MGGAVPSGGSAGGREQPAEHAAVTVTDEAVEAAARAYFNNVHLQAEDQWRAALEAAAPFIVAANPPNTTDDLLRLMKSTIVGHYAGTQERIVAHSGEIAHLLTPVVASFVAGQVAAARTEAFLEAAYDLEPVMWREASPEFVSAIQQVVMNLKRMHAGQQPLVIGSHDKGGEPRG